MTDEKRLSMKSIAGSSAPPADGAPEGAQPGRLGELLGRMGQIAA